MIITAFATTLRILANPFANVFQKRLMQSNIAASTVNACTYLILGLLCAPFAFCISWGSLPVEFWLYSLLVGILGALGNGFLVKALEKGDLSVLGPINAYKSLVGMVGGILLLGELPNLWGVLGIALIVWGSYFVLGKVFHKAQNRAETKKAVIYRVLALVFNAIEAVFIKKVILYSSTEVAFLSWCWFGAIFAVLFAVLMQNAPLNLLKTFTPRIAGHFLLLVLCIGLMQLCTNYVFAHMEVGYALSLFQLSSIISIVFGYKFFKETDIRRKLVGACIMIAGSVLIILLK